MRPWLRKLLLAGAGVAVVLVALVAWLNLRDEPDLDAAAGPAPTAEQVERGAYLARAGNCAACHTARGGVPYAGGSAIETPFGLVYASNITPDPVHGIGQWTAAQFWRAMHNGRSRDGRLLYPAFPYPNFTEVTRADSDAIHAYLRSVPPAARPNRPHALRFPYDSQAALAVWRALFFRPGVFEPDPKRSAPWNRGAYLVRGLGHCNACHASRNIFGATTGKLEMGGGLIPMQNWYAPSLLSPVEASVAAWDTPQVVALLRDGVNQHASVLGPMAEVVYRSTQHLSNADLEAMAVFLRELPQIRPEAHEPIKRDASIMTRGGTLYRNHCAQCHGDAGEGASGIYPPLAGNRAVTMDAPANLVRAVVYGGYLPSTAGNPRPFGMPPFSHLLDDNDVAALLTYIRGSWGNDAPVVVPLDVLHYR
ncbi:MAG TPA: cytochrome c [Albitalea sp.]|uniref:cytochrome c n=1 Tax=Piscinibacter sp. TaxID=1903157 RepID=UPI002ED09751